MGFFTIEDKLLPTLLVTWAVPAERLRARVPEPLRLQTVRGADGQELALLSVAAVRNVAAHPIGLPWLRLTCDQANYRTYVSYEGHDGVLFFGNFIAARLLTLPARAVTANVFYTKSKLIYRWPRRAGKPVGWRVRFDMRGAQGATLFDARGDFTPAEAPLLGAGRAGVVWLSQRLDGYLLLRGGRVCRLPVQHAEMEPWGGTLREVRADPWVNWGLLTPSEVAAPLVVMLQHESVFTATRPQLLPR